MNNLGEGDVDLIKAPIVIDNVSAALEAQSAQRCLAWTIYNHAFVFRDPES